MKRIKDVDVSGKRVLVRVDYNVPLDENGQISDDNRIRATLPLIRHVEDQGARTILVSHMGRPGGEKVPELSLSVVAGCLSRLLNREVGFAEDCIGEAVKDRVMRLKDGEILLLENLRFHREEKAGDANFAEELAGLCDVYVNEAFAVSHREQASVTGVPRFAPVSAAGFLLEKELNAFYGSVRNPVRPLVAIIGGAKVSGKLEALTNMLNHVDFLIIGGAMANTFLRSRGVDTKGSFVEAELVDTAADIIKKAADSGIKLLLPEDLVVADRFDRAAETREVDIDDIPDGWMAMDIGRKSAGRFAGTVEKAGTIVWNGPLGVFEMPPFMAGTRRIAQAVAAASAFSVVGGGDTDLAVKMCGAADKISYISTGGGAFLHLMEGKELPGVAALN